MSDEHNPPVQNIGGMTLHETDAFRTLLDTYFEDRTYRVDGLTRNGVTFHTLAAHVDSLLAARDAEIARLKARQITPEMDEAYQSCKDFMGLPSADSSSQRFLLFKRHLRVSIITNMLILS